MATFKVTCEKVKIVDGSEVDDKIHRVSFSHSKQFLNSNGKLLRGNGEQTWHE